MRRLWSLDPASCDAVLEALIAAKFLRRTPSDAYVRAGDSDNRSPSSLVVAATPIGGRGPTPHRESRLSRRQGLRSMAGRIWTNRAVVSCGSWARGIVAHLVQLCAGAPGTSVANLPVLVVLLAGGIFAVLRLALKALHGEFGADHLAAVSIVASALLGEYLAGAIVVVMLSSGEALEQLAVTKATAVLRALASRAPTIAHRRIGSVLEDVPVHDVVVGDELSIRPHEVCPVDGEVVQGRGSMDESYPTGEPFRIAKGPGAKVLSGAINGEASLTVRAVRVAADSRHAQIMHVMEEAEQRRPTLRRIGDQLGAAYTPLALLLAGGAWWWSGDPIRFLSVVVVATPCPLLIAIPVAIIGAVSTAARRGVIIKDPAALEQLTLCKTMILDKTGTLTYGRPALSDELYAAPFTREGVLPVVAAIETHSRHPLATAPSRRRTIFAYPLSSGFARSLAWPARRWAINGHQSPHVAGRFQLPPREPPVLNALCSSMTAMRRRCDSTTCRALRAAGLSATWGPSTGSRTSFSCLAIVKRKSNVLPTPCPLRTSTQVRHRRKKSTSSARKRRRRRRCLSATASTTHLRSWRRPWGSLSVSTAT